MHDRSALRYFDAGYQALVSVVPPNGIVSPASTLNQEDAGKAPGHKNYQGQYVGYNWMSHIPERHEVHQWLLDGSNVGMGAWAFPAIDIDVTDESLARAAISAVERVMGPCVVRRGRYPKALLIFRSREPLKSFDVRYEGDHEHPLIGRVRHLIQFLGRGRQYVVDGIHPGTGQPYTIEDPLHAFGLLGPQALPELTPEKVVECFDAIARVYGLLGFTATADASARVNDEDVSQDSLKAPSMVRLEAVVRELPNSTPDRDEYIAVGYAIKGASQDNPEAGLSIFQEWCSRWDQGYNDPEQVERDWGKMAAPYRTGFDWLLDRGRKWGVNMAHWDFGQAEAPPEGFSAVVADDDADNPPAHQGFTEIDLADEFIAAHKGKILSVADLDAVYSWDGFSWEKTDRNFVENEVREFLKRKSRLVPMMIENPVKQGETIARIMRYATIRNVTSQVVKSRRMSAAVEELDADPDVLNTPAGPYHLPTGTPLDPDPTLPLLKRTNVSPDPDAYCPRWHQFLAEVTGGDQDLIDYYQRLAGYALTGHTREQVFPFFVGSGGNGKTVFIEALAHAWGEYATTVPVELFQQRRSGGGNQTQEYYIARLVGARLVTTSETKTGGYWDEHRIKQLTGEDRVDGRMPYGRPFTFSMRATLVVIGNYTPELESVGEAMTRRLHIVPWNLKPAVRDNFLLEKLKAEAPGILAWAMEGARLWYQQGLGKPAAIADETNAYLEDQDVIGTWMADCLRVDAKAAIASEGFVSTEDLYQNYCAWKGAHGGRPMGNYKFSQMVAPRLQQIGARRGRVKGGNHRGWLGCTLSEPEILPPNVARFPGAERPPIAPVKTSG